MKDKIIEVENELEFYVLDELNENGTNYIYCVQTNEEKGLILDNYIICKITKDLNDNDYIEKITDNELFEKISNKFVERQKKQ